METAILSLAVMPEVDCNSNTLNAELEVKKLQDLVRKLERQNEQLRNRAQPPLSPPYELGRTAAATGAGYLGFTELGLHCLPQQGEDLGYFEPGAEGEDEQQALLDELELLDLDSMCSSSEEDSQETWLYTSQKSSDSSDGGLTALQWCRRALNNPKSELESSRRSLALRLEQISRWRSSLSTSSLSSSPPPSLSRITGMSPISTTPLKACSTPLSEKPAPLSSPLHSLLQRTLSPVPKDLSPVAERTPTFLPHLSKRSRSLQRSVFSLQSSAEEDDSVSLGFKLQDLTDVQVMARMQEESLRQELALPPRRSHSLGAFPSLIAGAPTGHEEECSDDDDYALPLPPPPAPRLTRLPHSHTFHALPSFSHWPRGAQPLDTPSHSSTTAGFAFHTTPLEPLELGSPFPDRGYRPGSDKLRRSLVRAPSMPSVPLPPSPSVSPRASPCVLRSQSFDLSSGLSPLQAISPPPGPLMSRVQSVGSFSVPRPPLKATAYVSPTIKSPAYPLPRSSSLNAPLSPGLSSSSGIPLLSKHLEGTPASPRAALSRPTSFISATSFTPRSKVALSGRSVLTPPKSLATVSALQDLAWRDGCY